jgi:TatD DNase family protein
MQTPFVIHCYTCDADITREYLKLNSFFGIGGIITFKHVEHLIDSVKLIPIERIMIETDSPYLSPVPNRGKRNDSSNLKYIANTLAKIKGITLERVIELTTNTAKNFFRI